MRRRVHVDPKTLLMDVQNIYNEIERELVENAADIINRSEYYENTFRGDRLNDVNVGIFLGDGRQFVVQIYVANQENTIKTHLKLSRDLRRVSSVDELINTFKKPIMYANTHTVTVKVYESQPFEERLANELELLKLKTGFTHLEQVSKTIEGDSIVYLVKGK